MQSDLARNRGLIESGAISKQDFAHSQADTTSSEATLDSKKKQLTDMRPGRPVEVAVDAYPARALRGHVEGVQAGSGVRFSLLPPENATGNFVKVVPPRAREDRVRGTAGGALIAILGALLYGAIAVLPLSMQNLLHYTALDVGLALSPRGIGAFLATILVGRLVGKVNNRILIAIGFVGLAYSSFLCLVRRFLPEPRRLRPAASGARSRRAVRPRLPGAGSGPALPDGP